MGVILSQARSVNECSVLSPLESYGELLGRQLRYVQDHSEFYRSKWRPLNSALVPSDLPTLPFTTRRELQDNQSAFGPFGSYLAARPDAIARVHRTSGSTGRALLIALSASDIKATVERGAACFKAAGVLPGDLVIHCLNYCMWSGGVTDHQCLEGTGAGVIPFGVGNTTELIETILRLRPSGIHCTPSYLTRLRERLKNDFGMKPSELGLRIGLFGGEPGLQDPRFRQRIEAEWGFVARDANYGMAEVLSIFGSECSAQSGLHFEGGDVILPEIRRLDSDETIGFEAGAVGELVITHLRRQCQPLVRYRTSDVVEILDTGVCACGRSSPRFRVVGRVDDMIVVRGINFFPSSIAEIINTFGGSLTGEYAILVDACDPISRMVIRVEACDAAAADVSRGQLQQAIVSKLGLRAEVEIVHQGTLPAGESKTKRVHRVL